MRDPVTITSLDDPRVDVYRDVREADLRGRDKLFMAESEMVIRRLLGAPMRVHSLFLSPNKLERLRDVVEPLADEIPVYLADIDLMSQIAGFHVHRGALAAGVRPTGDTLTLTEALGSLRDRDAFTLLIAEGITNVDNMGALFRNAAAFGVDGVLLDPMCCDPLYRKAIRVSMGHVLSVPWAVSEAWPDDLRRLRDEWGTTIIAAEVTRDAQPLWQMRRSPRVGLLFGSEGVGLSEAALGECDEVCAIPMAGDVPSVNVAVASAVFLYELNRAGSDSISGDRSLGVAD